MTVVSEPQVASTVGCFRMTLIRSEKGDGQRQKRASTPVACMQSPSYIILTDCTIVLLCAPGPDEREYTRRKKTIKKTNIVDWDLCWRKV